MKVRISHVRDSKLNLDYGWMFDIQTKAELMDYLEQVRQPMLQEDFADALKYQNGTAHANHVVYMAELKGINIVDALSQFGTAVWDGMFRSFQDKGRLFVNLKGGYFAQSPTTVIENTKTLGAFLLPGDNVRIIQWQDGVHFYAKIGNTDVVWEDKMKWDTREEEEQAAQKFLAAKR